MSHSQIDHEITRVLRSKDAAKISYDRMSKWYDWLAGSSEWQFTLAGLDLLNAQPRERILEIGYGTGKALLTLAQDVGPQGYIAGIDISTGMRAKARERLLAAGLFDSVDLRCGDALHLPFAQNLFDAVFISFTLELFDTPEIPILLASCKRVLREGGRIAIVAMAKRNGNNITQRIYNWAHRVIPNYADCRPIYTMQSVLQADFKILELLKKTMWGLPVDVILACNSIEDIPV